MTVSVLAIGDPTVDIILGPISQFPGWGEESEVANLETRLGGNLGNFAVAARLLGLDVVCAGPIGDDDNGIRVLKDLEAIGCSTHYVRSVVGGATCVSIGFVRHDGERLFVTHTGVLHRLGDFVRRLEPPVTDVAFFTGWCQPPRVDGPTLVGCFAALSARETRIVIDLNWSTESWNRKAELLEALQHVDFVLLNKDELAAIAGYDDLDSGLASLTAVLGNRPAVIVKRGAEGAASKRGDGPIVRARAPSVSPASAVGAGDSFNAAFIAAMFERQLGLSEAVDYACTFASGMVKKGRPNSAVGETMNRSMTKSNWQELRERAER